MYGTDFERGVDIFVVPENVQLVAALILLFIILSAFVLYILLWKLNLPRCGPFTAFIDVIIPFIGGGNIQICHKLEQYFFAIMYLSAFFIMTVFSGDIIDSVIRFNMQKISTFDQLRKINSSIYIDPEIALYGRIINSTLRLVSMECFDSKLLKFMFEKEKCLKLYVCRRNIGPNAYYIGSDNIRTILAQEKSFVYVFQAESAPHLKAFSSIYNRDYDELEESLGNTKKTNQNCFEPFEIIFLFDFILIR